MTEPVATETAKDDLSDMNNRGRTNFHPATIKTFQTYVSKRKETYSAALQLAFMGLYRVPINGEAKKRETSSSHNFHTTLPSFCLSSIHAECPKLYDMSIRQSLNYCL